MGWRHVRLGPGLVDEDQASRIEIGLRAQPGGASSLDIRAVELVPHDNPRFGQSVTQPFDRDVRVGGKHVQHSVPMRR
jgi:hypothetical protein